MGYFGISFLNSKVGYQYTRRNQETYGAMLSTLLDEDFLTVFKVIVMKCNVMIHYSFVICPWPTTGAEFLWINTGDENPWTLKTRAKMTKSSGEMRFST